MIMRGPQPWSARALKILGMLTCFTLLSFKERDFRLTRLHSDEGTSSIELSEKFSKDMEQEIKTLVQSILILRVPKNINKKIQIWILDIYCLMHHTCCISELTCVKLHYKSRQSIAYQ